MVKLPDIYCPLRKHNCQSLERVLEWKPWEGRWFPYYDYKCTAEYCPLRDVDKSQKK